ncbi:MAG: hypothetical protein H7Z40_13820 [Phycisphaerae bacterium]|nr:hypothetical protein [Gemmatimonadaceae bacterium]
MVAYGTVAPGGSLIIALLGTLAVTSCKPVRTERAPVAQPTASATPELFEAAHHIRVYVSALNCEMNWGDATRLNTLAGTPGVSVEVVFTGIAEPDSLILRQATTDLGLHVPTRIIRTAELEPYESIGGARLPMALVVKAKQLKTIIAGELMPRTLSLLEASMSPTAGQ